MARKRQSYLSNIDFPTFWIYLALVAVGGIFIYSVDIQQSGEPAGMADFLLNTQAGKQVMWIGISLATFMFIHFVIDHKFWQVFAYLIYGMGIAGLIAVLLFGTTIHGATSWFSIGGSTFQPSEIAKFGTCLGIAALLGHWGTDIRKFDQVLLVVGMFLVPSFFILLQPDAGSALVFFSFFLVLFREGLSPLLYLIGFGSAATFVLSILFPTTWLLLFLAWVGILIYALHEKQQWSYWLFGSIGFGAALVALIYFEQIYLSIGLGIVALGVMSYRQYTQFRSHLIPVVLVGFVLTGSFAIGSNYVFNNVLQPHQQLRINVWLQPAKAKKENKDSVMNSENSMFAISAGGLSGRGIFNGLMTQGRWVPEQNTDFIFCTIGEEQGFAGTAGVVLLFLLLLLRIIHLAERQTSDFARIYAYGVAGIIFVHVVVNICMTIGLLPIIGIPLPFISKGGSSLLGFTIMLAVLLKLDKHRTRQVKPKILSI